MEKEWYRRPRRPKRGGYSPDESSIERINRYFLGKGPKESRFKTFYPKGWTPSKWDKGNPRTIYPSASEREKNEKEKGLVKKVLGIKKVIGIISATLLGGSAFFVSTNITGSVIYSLSQENINLIGIIFFILGLAGLLFCIKKR